MAQELLNISSIMVAYEFYCRDKLQQIHLVGILPERRRNPERISQESIMNWAKKLLGDALDMNELYFIQVEV